ncbi:uncharacterized protein HD556DRAFT_1382150 [Suillus plorans]|uniref:Uncharacterized protein n=1 Tax=Suillus plorans TaxID=116603 RepID=A0A9P7DGR6_9AGAM|nr:uncharacterized protein HD556DRAFT_1382150 [Suillus plorans]KAG1791994.1 hypothetical protein HD556DRAFT_1382150 [Suillus plorans]
MYLTLDGTDLSQHRMDLHRNSEAKTATATVQLPFLEQQDVNIETHGKHITISMHLKRSKRADIRYSNICMANLLGYGNYIVQAKAFHRWRMEWLPCASSRKYVMLSACCDM